MADSKAQQRLRYLFLDVDDFLGSPSVQLMSAAQIGGYVLLLMYCWRSPVCGLPKDDAVLLKLSRLKTGNFSRVRTMFVDHPDPLRTDLVTNLRLLREHNRVRDRHGKKATAAEKARASRWKVPANGSVEPLLSEKKISVEPLLSRVEEEEEGEREREGERETNVHSSPKHELAQETIPTRHTGRKEEKRGRDAFSANRKAVADPAKTALTWTAYALAYQQRYGVPPIRNAKVNAMLAQLVRRVGETEAPLIARFYLQHNDAFYVKRMHGVPFLLNDAEKLRTEWASGRKMTRVEASSAEQGDAMREQSARVVAALTARFDLTEEPDDPTPDHEPSQEDPTTP